MKHAFNTDNFHFAVFLFEEGYTLIPGGYREIAKGCEPIIEAICVPLDPAKKDKVRFTFWTHQSLRPDGQYDKRCTAVGEELLIE